MTECQVSAQVWASIPARSPDPGIRGTLGPRFIIQVKQDADRLAPCRDGCGPLFELPELRKAIELGLNPIMSPARTNKENGEAYLLICFAPRA
jgi:hypothetical protein